MRASALSVAPLIWSLLLICNADLNEEATALLSFKNSIRDDPGGSLTNWNSSGQDPCHWNGVTCKQSTVVSLSLPKNGLLGTLPSSLGSLTSLRHINLRSNRLYGSLPPEIFRPRSLQSLVLYGNSLSGSLPSEIGSLVSLQMLDLSYNLLNGSMPISLIRCKRLRTLVLSHNNFSGSLPLGLGTSLSALESFDVSFNRLTGAIPSDIGNLSSLQGTVDLSHNLFSGLIPSSIGNLPEKVYVDLSYNNLSGPIPQNGTLVNRGISSFIGNPSLCGPPLKNPCTLGSVRNGGRVKRSLVIALIVSDVFALGIIGLLFYYLYRRAISHKGIKGPLKSNGDLKRNECLCFGENEVEKFGLVPLDKHVNFDLEELLQATAFIDDGRTFAVRRFGEGGQKRRKEFELEVEAIAKVRHANIVALRAYYWSVEEKLLVYDYIPNGSLSTALHGQSGVIFSPMSWRVRLKIMKGIAKGLAFLHGHKYIHGDLKPKNILLGLKMEPYISDFAVGRLARLAEDFTPERPQSQFSDSAVSPVSPVTDDQPYYRPPEAFRTLKPTNKWDVYSYGVILLELISGQSPEVLLDTMEMDLVQWFQFCIKEKKPTFDVFDPYLSQEPNVEDEIIAVLKIALACVQPNPESRPTMRHVKDSLEGSIPRS
ncbi:uncharacterized protein A4U43_C01F31630 [Asparagus officinalis]|uniref:Protein kinase domain-containing protein n=1 Tax=Asparagus officinalis TaxID=4686 RepID=A0A5P1FTM2_ASPOF|nr:receptor protein kinase-like protein ZAR1 [Asparagus officinalis]ONK81665.1 uncharacterized protein A4U43_C01F31630 [Asparagus officinalis]